MRAAARPARPAPRCGPDRRSMAHSTVFGAPGVSAGSTAFVTTSSTWSVSNTASSTTSQCATSSSVAAMPPALANAAVLAASMSKPFGENPRRSAGAPARCRAGRAPRCRSAAPWSCVGDLVQDREQRLRIGDVRVVARVDLVSAPALALRALGELAEGVADAGLGAVDVAARQRGLGRQMSALWRTPAAAAAAGAASPRPTSSGAVSDGIGLGGMP